MNIQVDLPLVNNNRIGINRLSLLTFKEKEVMFFLMKGLLYKEIADAMSVTIDTIKKHAKNIYKKLNVRNRTEAANIAAILI